MTALSKTLKIVDAQIAELESELVELREQMDAAESNSPHRYLLAAMRVSSTAHRLDTLKRFKKSLLETK